MPTSNPVSFYPAGLLERKRSQRAAETKHENTVYRSKETALVKRSASRVNSLSSVRSALGEAPPDAIGLSVRPRLSGSGTVQAVVEVVPPVKMICKLSLSSKQGQIDTSKAVQQLRDTWARTHEPAWKADLQSFGKVVYESTFWCRKAGFCLHSVGGKHLLLFLKSLTGSLVAALAPQALCRDIYDKGALVLCLTSSTRTSRCINHRWYHVGYGNLSDQSFTVLPLFEVDGLPARLAAAVGNVALRNGATAPRLGVGNLFRISSGLRYPARPCPGHVTKIRNRPIERPNQHSIHVKKKLRWAFNHQVVY